MENDIQGGERVDEKNKFCLKITAKFSFLHKLEPPENENKYFLYSLHLLTPHGVLSSDLLLPLGSLSSDLHTPLSKLSSHLLTPLGY